MMASSREHSEQDIVRLPPDERPEQGDRVAEDAGEPISAAASRGSDGRLRLHMAVARTRRWRRATVTGSRRGVRQCGKARHLEQRMANALPSPGRKSLWPILVVRESLTARSAIRREEPLVRIYLAPPRFTYLILHMNVAFERSNSRLFPEACGGCIFRSPRRDDFPAILCRFRSSSLEVDFRWYGRL